MAARAVLFYLKQEIELTKVEYSYFRPFWKHNGMPKASVQGGNLLVDFGTNSETLRFYEEMRSDYFSTYGKNNTMPKCKVEIYDANGDRLKTYNHLDVIIKDIKNTFIEEGKIPMMTYVEFTIGVQNYGFKHTKSWNISDAKPEPYKTPVVAEEKEDF